MSHFVTCLLISVVYIIALCSSINTTTFFSLYVRCCPALDLTVVNWLTVPNFLFFKYNSYLTRVVLEKIYRMDQCGNITTSS
jgi:hypothetical protein